MKAIKRASLIFSAAIFVSAACAVTANAAETGFTITDVTNVQKYTAQIVDLTDEQKSAYDVDGSGEVDITDATAMQKWIAQLYTPSEMYFDVEECKLYEGMEYSLSLETDIGSMPVFYSSSDASVAAVSGYGKITAVSEGTAVVSATASNGVTAECTVTVCSLPESVTLNALSIKIGVGETYKLTADASGHEIFNNEWSSSDSGVASVAGDDGSEVTVTGESVGTSVVTVRLYNGVTAECAVTVCSAPESVTLNASSIKLGVGETYKLTADASEYEISNAEWSSSDSGAASVAGADGTATVTGESVGTSVVTVRLYNGVTAECTVTVYSAPTSVTLNKTSLTLGVGQTYTIKKTINDGSYTNISGIKWSSSSSGVAAIAKDKNGNVEVTAKKAGTSTVRVKLYNGVYADCKVTIKAAPTKVTLNSTYIVLAKGSTYTLKESVNSGAYVSGSGVSWSSADTSIATVKKGSGSAATVTAKAVGSTKITVKLYNGKTASCTVVVVTKKNVKALSASVIKNKAAWSGKTLKSFSKGAKLNKMGTSGNWVKVEYDGTIGYVYNRTFKSGYNYTSVTTSTLGAVIDDWFFEHGTSIKTIFNYCHNISYCAMSKGNMKEMCVHVIKYRYGACYHHAAILQYMLDRAGYEAIYIQGIDKYTGGGPHAWVMVKTSDGWRHIDATKISGLSTFYLVKDSVISPYFSWDRSKYPAAK